MITDGMEGFDQELDDLITELEIEEGLSSRPTATPTAPDATAPTCRACDVVIQAGDLCLGCFTLAGRLETRRTPMARRCLLASIRASEHEDRIGRTMEADAFRDLIDQLFDELANEDPREVLIELTRAHREGRAYLGEL